MVSGDAGVDIFRHESGKGTDKLGFVTCIVAYFASRSGLFTAIGSCFRSCVGRYPQACWMAAAAGSCVSVGHRVWSRLRCGSCDVRYLHNRMRLLLPWSRLLFDRGKCEFIAAAASVAAMVSWQEGWMVAAAASVGPIAFVVCYQFSVDILGSRFASVHVEATPRVDVDPALFHLSQARISLP